MESYFSRNIKRLRRAKRLSQEKLADMLDLTRSTISAYENGKSEASYNTLIQLSTILGVSIDDLLKKRF